jgi:hypothetical protein
MKSLEENAFLIELPEIFNSDATNGPFEKCMNCERNLLKPPQHYIIEKAVKQYKDYKATDTIFEYAICLKCHGEFMGIYSEESLQKIQEYFKEHVDFEARHKVMRERYKDNDFDSDEWLSNCIIKGTGKKQMSEYQVGCQCYGDQMVVMNMPFLIGDEAMDELSQLLSNKTIDKMDGFIDEFFGLPPDLKKLIKDTGVVIL